MCLSAAAKVLFTQLDRRENAALDTVLPKVKKFVLP